MYVFRFPNGGTITVTDADDVAGLVEYYTEKGTDFTIDIVL